MTANADAKLRIGADVSGAKQAVRGLQGNVSNLNGTVKTGQERIEKLATAVTGTSSVLGGMGAKAGAAAGAVSNLAMAFLAGGPALVALSAAATAGAFAFGKLSEAFEETERQAKLADSAMKAVGDAIRDRTRKQADGLVKSLQQVQKELSLMGFSAAERAVVEAQDEEFGIRGQIESLEKNVKRQQKKIAGLKDRSPAEASIAVLSGNEDKFQKNLKTQKEMLATYRQQLEAARDALPNAVKLTDDLELRLEHQKELNRLEKQRRDALKAAGVKIKDTGGNVIRERTRQGISEARLRAAQARQEEEQLAKERAESAADFEAQAMEWVMGKREEAYEWGNAKELKAEKEKEKERTRILREETANREAIERQHVDLVMKFAQETISFVASVTDQVFNQLLDVVEQLAAGQEVAFAQIAASFIRNIGTQIFGIGLRFASEGAGYLASSLIPGNQGNIPGAVALISNGTAMMATGGTMAVTGAVASGMVASGALPSLSVGGSASGGGGGALAGGGIAPRGSAGDGGQAFQSGRGNVTINFNGGTQLGDPTERALTMARDQRRARRNVYIPPGT